MYTPPLPFPSSTSPISRPLYHPHASVGARARIPADDTPLELMASPGLVIRVRQLGVIVGAVCSQRSSASQPASSPLARAVPASTLRIDTRCSLLHLRPQCARRRRDVFKETTEGEGAAGRGTGVLGGMQCDVEALVAVASGTVDRYAGGGA
jgi:hypothetical protein